MNTEKKCFYNCYFGDPENDPQKHEGEVKTFKCISKLGQEFGEWELCETCVKKHKDLGWILTEVIEN